MSFDNFLKSMGKVTPSKSSIESDVFYRVLDQYLQRVTQIYHLPKPVQERVRNLSKQAADATKKK